MNRILCLIFLSLLSATAVAQDNWSHWRGPTGNGVSETAKPPIEWDANKNVKWKVAIDGRGSGSPVIWEDKVFVVTAVTDGEGAAPAQPRRRRQRGVPAPKPTKETWFDLLCFNRDNGDLIWRQTAVTKVPHQGVHGTNNYASASPCTDGEHVYADFGSRGVYCYTLDGDLVWKYDKFEPMMTRAGFGEGSSPVLADDKLILPYDHEGQSKLYAFNKLTGDIVWEKDRNEPTNWGTPLIVEHDGRKQVVTTGQTKVRAYDLETGDELWTCGGQTERPVASPVKFGDMVVVTSGHRGSFLGAFKLDGKGDIQGTEKVAWTLNRNTPDIGSPVLSDNRLYFYKAKTGVLSCYNVETGQPFFDATRTPQISSTYASPVVANGYVYLTGRDGTTVVIKDAEKYEVVSINSVGEGVDASPAPVDDELFIRGEKHLFCIEAKTK
ncbi:PQQ-binding-like beta-propeller repeat protein [Mariniblastus sp.]|nr:PQQ-binding-like beta-propeller repeat protein [Mariniblastus sp.]